MTGRHVIGLTTSVLALALAVNAQVKDGEGIALHVVIKQSLAEGDQKGAIERFKKLAQSSRPEIAAEALVHLGAGYERLGQSEDARAAYERVVRDYPNQAQSAALAQSWLDGHRAPSRLDISVER